MYEIGPAMLSAGYTVLYYAAHVAGLQGTAARCGSGQWLGKLFIYLSDFGLVRVWLLTQEPLVQSHMNSRLRFAAGRICTAAGFSPSSTGFSMQSIVRPLLCTRLYP
jgi:hypothetical protein